MQVISKAEARAAGLSRYFTGKPCRRGHLAERYLTGQCVVCVRVTDAAWSHVHADKVAESRQRWAVTNPEKDRQAKTAWRTANPERQALATRRWEERNRARRSRMKSLWDLSNPSKVRMYVGNRRARKLACAGNVSGDIVAILWSTQGGLCACPCKASLQSGYNIDHIVALARGGAHEDGNLQLLTPLCNRRKGVKPNSVFFDEQRRRLQEVQC